MKSYLRVRLVDSGVLALVFLWGCAATQPTPRHVVFAPARGQVPEQVTADAQACHWTAERAPAFDQFVRPALRSIEPQSLRVQINCMTGIGYMVFLTNGQTKDQFEADMRTCAPAAMKEKAKQGLSDDDVKGFAVCMHGRGYSVAT